MVDTRYIDGQNFNCILISLIVSIVRKNSTIQIILAGDTPKGTWCLHLKFFSFTVVPGCCANGLFMIMNAVLVYSFCSKWLFPDYCQGGVSELLEYSAIKSAFIFLKKMPVLSFYYLICIAPKYVLRFVSQRSKNAD